ncbi:MAG: hypothetical protein JWN50_563 [Parcubacteria group bacterium]|nr:hypothetical protein [Parcubacteria group bacterium]
MPRQIPRTIRRRVRRGAKRLDYVRPGWAKRIDVDRLDISYDKDCIAGQLEGSFGSGYHRLNLPGDSIQNGMQCDRSMREHALLTRAWKEEVGERTPSRGPQNRFGLLRRFVNSLPLLRRRFLFAIFIKNCKVVPIRSKTEGERKLLITAFRDYSRSYFGCRGLIEVYSFVNY